MFLLFLAFLIMAIIGGGLSPTFVKLGTQEFPPLTLTFLRFLIASLIIFPIWLRNKQYIHKKDIFKLLPFSLNVMIFSIAIQYASVIMSGVASNLVPVLVAVFGYVLLKEKLTKIQIVGLFSAIIGVSILLDGAFKTKDIFSFGTPLGTILLFIGAICFSFYPVFGRSLGKKYSKTTILFFSFLFTCVLLLFCIPFEWTVRPIVLSKITLSGIFSIVFLAVFSSLCYYALYQFIINRTSAFVSSLTQYAQFTFSVLFGMILFQEYVTPLLAVGILLVLGGVFLSTTYQAYKKSRRSSVVQ